MWRYVKGISGKMCNICALRWKRILDRYTGYEPLWQGLLFEAALEHAKRDTYTGFLTGARPCLCKRL